MSEARPSVGAMSDDEAALRDLISAHAADFALPGVLSVRPGYLFRGGWITAERAVVVTVQESVSSLPTSVAGVPVDVRVASPRKAMRLQDPARYASEVGPAPDFGAVPEFADELLVEGGSLVPVSAPLHPEASKPELTYTPAPGASLTPVDVSTSIVLSASPDSGWPVLSAFLGATTSTLTLSMYDFTSAHILSTVEKALAGKTVKLTLDHPAKNPTADQTDEQTVAALDTALGSDFTQAWALERMDPLAAAWIFPSAYHIKVAVRDSSVVWLSSGNWNDSNQPDIDPVTTPGDAQAARSGDRDWHVVISDAGLAKTFEAYLLHDLEIAAAHRVSPGVARFEVAEPAIVDLRAETPPFAEFFPPTTVTDTTRITPLLTPDPGVYVDAVTDLVSSAATSLHLQFQYIELPKTPSASTKPFSDLVAAVIDRQKAGVDVKIILSEYETAGYLEQLQAAGLDVTAAVKIQNNVHNKGIVVDGKRVLVSSQNWSGAGVLANRDAGVILDGVAAAAYFDTLFLHDWEHLATQKASTD
jgi:phosphatidylserine/phosphatidylglycerophosphate/cardiolipin synthase-like enzyme